jgi:hypothetical protein
MKRLAFLAVLAALALTACGGSGDDNGLSGGPVSPDYVGRWVGPWQSSGPLGGQDGTGDLTVSSDGKLLGTLSNNALSTTGNVQGTIDSTGKTSGSYSYPLYNGTFNGTFTLQSNGHLGGAVKTYDTAGKDTGTVTFDLTKQ